MSRPLGGSYAPDDGYSWYTFTFIDNLSAGIITKTQSLELIFED